MEAISKNQSRALLPEEITEAKKVFGHKIDYSKVQIVFSRYTKIQGVSDICTPNNNIYWPLVEGRPSAVCNKELAHLFIHEMAHVLQYQIDPMFKLKGCAALGLYLLKGRKMSDSPYVYKAGKTWKSYNVEQQAEMTADAYQQGYSLPLGKPIQEQILSEFDSPYPIKENQPNLNVPVNQWVKPG